MNEQRRQVLQMLAEGKITADEAERLISALERDQPESPTGAAFRPKSRPKYLRVLVSSRTTAPATARAGSTSRSRCNCCAPAVRVASLILRRRSPGSMRR